MKTILWYINSSKIFSKLSEKDKTNNGGVKGFMGGLVGHIVYGLSVALTYGLFIH
ncbi:MAG: hypothetical protein M1591_01530 [Deltaproteobacteria bacterium]|nr:hypothetical protein [Deltaproteobacteria bacterium]